jgi:uncharacterized protein YqeY
MALLDEIKQQMVKALKEGQRGKVSILRFALSALYNKEKELGRPLKDEEAYSVIRGLIKKGKEAVEQFRQGKREDLAQKEEEEIRILKSFLPKPLSEEELERMILEAIKEVGAKGPKDHGKIMKLMVSRVAGRVESEILNHKVRKILESLSS